jgi:hypothetical protein
LRAVVAEAGHQGRGRRNRLELHHAAVLCDAVLAERRELDSQVEAGEEVLFDSGEHVFVKVGEPADGSGPCVQHLLHAPQSSQAQTGFDREAHGRHGDVIEIA